MNIYEYTPPKDRKKATGVVVILFSLAAGLFLFTMLLDIPYEWIIQLIAVVAFTASIFIGTRYLAKNFSYLINKDEDSTLDLDIIEITNGGRKKITVCRISLSSIQEVHVINKTDKILVNKEQELIKKAKQERLHIFNYCPDINPVKYSILIGEECDEKFLIKLTPDKMLCEYFKAK